MKYFGWMMLLLSMFVISCKKEAVTTPDSKGYDVPSSYSFANANYKPSAIRMKMLDEMVAYIETAHSASASPAIDASRLLNMYANSVSPFADTSLNLSGLQLRNQAGESFGFSAALENAFSSASAASVNAASLPSSTTASDGKPGKIVGPARSILVDAQGIECAEVVEKGIMGSVFYYRAAMILDNLQDFDNSTPVNGATARERAWDEAFGYFGVPASFPSQTTSLIYWGKYCNAVSNSLGGSPTLNATIMNAWLKGRAAVSARDDASATASARTVLTQWEKMMAAKTIGYLKTAKANPNDAATYHHNLSEAIGFIYSLRYNAAKTITDSDIAVLIGCFSTGGAVNIYQMPLQSIDTAMAKLAQVYSLDPAKL
jgi:hypothetical protein